MTFKCFSLLIFNILRKETLLQTISKLLV